MLHADQQLIFLVVVGNETKTGRQNYEIILFKESLIITARMQI
jgi:hypothetical protein